jgi:FAD/FMN-containing dehydrogenase
MNPSTITLEGASGEVRALRERLEGGFVVPSDPGWDEARQAWNLAVEQRPAAVALPESAADVVTVVQVGRRLGLRLAPQGTGHAANPLGPLDDGTILVKLHRMRGVVIDPGARTARAEAGATWADVVHPAAEHGLAALHGSSPDVGVVGYSLGGGVGWYARSLGLAANSVIAVELVTADGRLVRADAEHEPELFWALRGGGGSFGIVTAIEFRLYPIREVYAGALFFPLARASEVLDAWSGWADDLPDEVTSLGRILRVPPLPEVPEPLRGREFALVEAVFIGDEATGAELMRPLRELGPEIDTFAKTPTTGLGSLHMDPQHPVPASGDGQLLAELPPEAVAALVERAGAESGSPLLSVEIRNLGGALGRSAPEHGVTDRIDAGFALFTVGIAATPEMAAAVEASTDAVLTALAPWEAKRGFLNFSERRTDGNKLFGPAYERLRSVKATYDPDDVFRSNHPVPPA